MASKTLLFLALIAAALALPVQAGNERIANLRVAVPSNNEIRVSAELIRWLDPALEEEIRNGIPKDLFFTFVLLKRTTAWFDEEIASKTVQHTIKYDVLKKQYLITTWEGDKNEQRVVESTQAMIDLISRADHVKIAFSKTLKKRYTYYVSVKAEVKESRLPFFLEYILFFIPVLELETPWASSAPFYAVEQEP
jgi:hypothetical protein